MGAASNRRFQLNPVREFKIFLVSNPLDRHPHQYGYTVWERTQKKAIKAARVQHRRMIKKEKVGGS